MRRRLRKLYRRLRHPLNFFWDWAGRTSPANRGKRWKALKNLAGHRMHAAAERKDWKTFRRWKRVRVVYARRQHRADRRWNRIKKRRRQQSAGASTSLWGGAQAAGEKEVARVAGAFGVWISSRKRAASDPLSISNPSSDHNEANENAYAWDIATYSGDPIARAIARELGIGGYTTGNYNGYTIRRPWGTYRVQILWAVSGHYNHVHVGFRRV